MAFYPIALLPPQFSNPSNGENASGFILQARVAGTTTLTDFYSDDSGTSVGSSITLDSGGFTAVSGNVFVPYLDDSVTYKFTLTDPDTLIQFTVDNLADVSNSQVIETVSNATDFVFATVATMKVRQTHGGTTVTVSSGDTLRTQGYHEAGGFGAATYIVKTTAEAATDGDTIDGMINHALDSGDAAVLVLDGTFVKPEHCGVYKDGSTDDQPGLQACADYAADKGFAVFGGGDYYLSSTVEYNINVMGIDYMMHRTLADFADGVTDDIDTAARTVVRLGTSDIHAMNVRCNNDASTTNCRGIWAEKNNIKLTRCVTSGFKVGCLMTNYSITAYECRFVNGSTGGKGIVAYAPTITDEINAIAIIGGQFFQNNAAAIDIGDCDDWFATTVASNDYHGNDIRLVACPTLDQGSLRIDRVINVIADVYLENGGAGIEKAIELGGAFEQSVINCKIHGYARDYDYYVYCRSGVNGLEMSNCHSRGMTYSNLYLTTDQYPYKYFNNTNIGSVTDGQEVHTGIRAGRTGNNVFEGAKTIDTHNLFNGQSFDDSIAVYPYTTVREERGQKFYNNTDFRRFVTPVTGVAGTLDTSAKTFTVTTLADCQDFNGGDDIQITGTGTVNTYIRSVDYATGEMLLDDVSGGSNGTGDIAQLSALPFFQGFESSAPSRTDVRAGSVVYNRNANTGQPMGWIFDGTSWDTLPNVT